jgi:hypothetical protein
MLIVLFAIVPDDINVTGQWGSCSTMQMVPDQAAYHPGGNPTVGEGECPYVSQNLHPRGITGNQFS